MSLSEQVYQYYLKHFSKLPQDKQFHFASRLAAWNDDNACLAKLSELESYLLPSDSGDGIKDILTKLISDPPNAKINAAEVRAPYFARYPELRGLMFALFRVRHLNFVYGVDTRPQLLEIRSLEQLQKDAEILLADRKAVKVLSTYAINYIYLVKRILFDSAVDVNTLYSYGDDYDTSDPTQILLLIYLYTHCIIGESNFYMRGIEQNKDIYLDMLRRIETLIDSSYDDINLDNKLEFLVCCQIAGFDTRMRSKIHDECEQSLSPEGTFLIDTVNNAVQSTKISFENSEHRNVLYIMSHRPFKHG